MTPETATLIGAGINAGSNLVGQLIGSNLQNRLSGQQYSNYIRYAKLTGATPAAISQGITGSGPSSIPQLSSVPSMPDVGSNLIHAADVSSEVQKRESEMANLETERRLKEMRLNWEPKKFVQDIRESVARVEHLKSGVKLNTETANYYHQFAISLETKLPWEIKQLEQGLKNAVATYDNIMADTKLKRKQAFYTDTMARGQFYQNQLNRTFGFDERETSLIGQQQRIFEMQFNNALRQGGWNPNDNFWENVRRLAIQDPEQFEAFSSNALETLNILDGKLETQLGEHYKRNIAIAAGLRYANDRIGLYRQNKSKRALRNSKTLNNVLGSVGSIISASNGMPLLQSSSPGVDWWMYD